MVSFAGYFTYQFIRSNLMVLLEVLRPRPVENPAIIAVPLRCESTAEITAMANLITLTPGTLTLEVALDPPTLYVHGMFAADPARFVADLHEMEDRLLAAMRSSGRDKRGSS
jgi:multicomponent Na+:H+ antiporter subunit E